MATAESEGAGEEVSATGSALPRTRRIVFPFVWVTLLIVARLLFGWADVTVDFMTIATLATAALSVLGVALWYVVRGRAPLAARAAVGLAPFILGWGFLSLYEIKFRGDGSIEGVHRRGAPKPDELLDQVAVEAAQEGLANWGPGDFDYPRFLGTAAWAESTGPSLAADWSGAEPVELWRRPIGAGWSSFAVVGNYAVTQEQRGEQELVVCYDLRTGEPVWSHADDFRYTPVGAGEMGRIGPRATPTIVGDRVYTQGAAGRVNCLDAKTGVAVWTHNVNEEYGAEVAVWGKSGSPLYVAAAADDGIDLVIINVGAPAEADEAYDASLVAFNAATGEEVWRRGNKQTSYASPQLAQLHGERVVLQTCDLSLVGYAAETGEPLISYDWPGTSDNMPSCSQPIAVPDNRLLMTKGYGYGSSLLQVSREGDRWSAAPVWNPPVRKVLQTKYSSVVVRDGHAFGLNGDRLQCVEIATGERTWRKRRKPSFGFGQVLMTADHVVVLTEAGEIVVANADPDRYSEVASFQALSPDETCWNNPVLVGDVLLTRNSVEAAAYRLPLASGTADTATEEPPAEAVSSRGAAPAGA